MVYYKYKKEKLEEKFSESKVFLVRIRECLERSPNSEDEIIDEAMISYFNSFCEFIIDMCETYLVSTDNFIPNKSGPDIIQLSSDFGFISKEDSKRLQGIVKLRNRYIHDYYQRKLSRDRILNVCRKEIKTLDMFLEISNEKITLVLK
ncbi:DUF86 domain-containing protein [Clostridium botulinum]|uniref:DUF86 domain-containing protein n=1 Tax=Clostridium botulinum TaxID=1491 RepID=A0A6B4JRV7_CLOBO|nr:HepT-like ribonuclease domain-containing protein [Clostridium botulinum]EES48324.1 conserved hypothetical protein [Clostridium botulinum E1 str. 'BoNT E Beluga']MBY6762810.1 DUF86 domain-containing protein [Clostridium botulinum]MBY6921594.1 DUF86 domain-containing protein [Clostridium botulinum]MCR1132742.1 DUF86 domain-containing protein [Clostridium botulinum]NFJ59517.1 DUF86 domain-containing protein [Clostridium botulinum]